MIICRLVDCEEDWGLFPFVDKDTVDPVVFDKLMDARRAMCADCKSFESSYDVSWSADGKNHCKKTVSEDGLEISVSIPIWDGENQRDSWIHAKWKVVSL